MKKHRAPWARKFHRLLGDQSGATIVFLGAAIFLLVTAVGVAVDMGRLQLVRNKMHSALDAAAISAAGVADSQSSQLNAHAMRYFHGNFPANYMDSTIQSVGLISANEDLTVLRFRATGQVKAAFLQVVGLDEFDASVESEVVRSREEKILELALVLDVTGSMNNLGKLNQLKQAVGVMLNLLYGNDDSLPNLTVSLAPYAAVVNIGTNRGAWVTPAPNFLWAGCVRERSLNDGEQPPGPGGLFPKYDYNPPSFDEECPASPVRPLMSSKAAVQAAVNALVAEGSTRINLGLQWGWRTLSPLWSGSWGLSGGLPRPYDTPNLSKVVILMTDGDNRDTTLPTTDEADNISMANTCNAMKAQGIIIYTIGFALDGAADVNPAEARALLQGCASRPDYYFEAPEGNELVNAFRTIGDALKTLRLSE